MSKNHNCASGNEAFQTFSRSSVTYTYLSRLNCILYLINVSLSTYIPGASFRGLGLNGAGTGRNSSPSPTRPDVIDA